MPSQLANNSVARELKKLLRKNQIAYSLCYNSIVPNWPNRKQLPPLTFSFNPRKKTVKVWNRKSCRTTKNMRCTTLTQLLEKLLHKEFISPLDLKNLL